MVALVNVTGVGGLVVAIGTLAFSILSAAVIVAWRIGKLNGQLIGFHHIIGGVCEDVRDIKNWIFGRADSPPDAKR